MLFRSLPISDQGRRSAVRLTAETQRAQREDNFSFAVERTAKENYPAALLHNNLTLMHYYSLSYHCEVLRNAPKGLVLIVFRRPCPVKYEVRLTGGNEKQ